MNEFNLVSKESLLTELEDIWPIPVKDLVEYCVNHELYMAIDIDGIIVAEEELSDDNCSCIGEKRIYFDTDFEFVLLSAREVGDERNALEIINKTLFGGSIILDLNDKETSIYHIEQFLLATSEF